MSRMDPGWQNAWKSIFIRVDLHSSWHLNLRHRPYDKKHIIPMWESEEKRVLIWGDHGIDSKHDSGVKQGKQQTSRQHARTESVDWESGHRDDPIIEFVHTKSVTVQRGRCTMSVATQHACEAGNRPCQFDHVIVCDKKGAWGAP